MANKKFSEFTTKTDPANVDFVVGYDGSTNVKIAPSNLSSGGATSLNGLTDVLIDGTSSYFINIPASLSGNPEDNIIIGSSAGNAITTGTRHTVIGHDAASTITTANSNTVYGYEAAKGMAAGSDRNVIIGDMACRTNAGDDNVSIGSSAGTAWGSGVEDSVAIGSFASGVSAGASELVTIGKDAGRSNTSAGHTSVGFKAGYSQTSGLSNTNVGYKAGYQNTTNANRTYMGYEAGNYNSGANNTGIGYRACNGYYSFGTGQGTGADNTGVGYEAMSSLNGASAIKNTAVGVQSLGGVLTAGDNTALGYRSGQNVTSGANNTIIGSTAMDANTDGNDNVAVGYGALGAETSGDRNTAIGYQALGAQNQTYAASNTAVGYQADDGTVAGNQRTCLGAGTGGSGDGVNIMCLGYAANPSSTSVDNEITLGNSSVATLRCQVTSITALSDERDKTSIEVLPYGLDFVNSLQPKKFVWDNRAETNRDGEEFFSANKGKKDIGFIAQELQSVDDDFLNLVYDSNPEKLEATYGRLIPVLVKAIQDLSAKVTALENA